MRRCTGRGRLTRAPDGTTRDPGWTLDRLRTLLWRYEGGSAYDWSLDIALAYQQPEQIEQRLYRDCVYLARYLRQPMSWVDALSLDEMRKWIEAVSDLVGGERTDGLAEAAAPAAGGPVSATARPFPGKVTSLGDWDGGG